MGAIIGFDYISTHNDFTLALCSFLDEFRRAVDKYKMIEVPPPIEGLGKEQRCLLAAVSHKLANDNAIDVPAWVHEPDYRMPYPVFAFNTKNKEYQDILLRNTPFEFASKNIYHGANAIDRA